MPKNVPPSLPVVRMEVAAHLAWHSLQMCLTLTLKKYTIAKKQLKCKDKWWMDFLVRWVCRQHREEGNQLLVTRDMNVYVALCIVALVILVIEWFEGNEKNESPNSKHVSPRTCYSNYFTEPLTTESNGLTREELSENTNTTEWLSMVMTRQTKPTQSRWLPFWCSGLGLCTFAIGARTH